jgi:hypothetical protein
MRLLAGISDHELTDFAGVLDRVVSRLRAAYAQD